MSSNFFNNMYNPGPSSGELRRQIQAQCFPQSLHISVEEPESEEDMPMPSRMSMAPRVSECRKVMGFGNKVKHAHKKLWNRLKGDRSKFCGNTSDWTRPNENVPWIVSEITNELESREDLRGVYSVSANEEEVRRLKKRLRKEENAPVRIKVGFVNLASRLTRFLLIAWNR